MRVFLPTLNLRLRASACIYLLAGSIAFGCSNSNPIEGLPDDSQQVDGEDGPRTEWPNVQPGSDDPLARQWHRAGSWYDEDPPALSSRIQSLLDTTGVTETLPARAILTPHAGLAASGEVAAEVWARIQVPDLILVMAPNHDDIGARAAVWPGGPWLVPGVAQWVDEALSAKLASSLQGAVLDREAFEHILAHPSEMQLPFISRIRPNASILMLSFYDYEKAIYPGVSAEQIKLWGQALASFISDLEDAGREVLLVGSTDLSHYEPVAVNDPWDAEMMDAISQLDNARLRDRIVDGGYTICGEIVVSVFISTLRNLGYTQLDWWIRGNSRHLSGPDGVVGYPGGIVWR